MILIPSAQFVQGDLRSEFGDIPPAFLPLGNKPLYLMQVSAFRAAFPSEDIVISVPESFEVGSTNENILARLGCKIVRVPASLTLADSILLVLNVSGFDSGSTLRILHGDTFIPEIPHVKDVIGVANSADQYDWQYTGEDNDRPGQVWCGYFSFSEIPLVVRSLAVSHGSFVEAVKLYSETIATELVPISGWMDVGHLNTYFRTRERFTTERHFNNLTVTGGVVVKSGIPSSKILGEANWFESLPGPLRVYSPQLLFRDDERSNYGIEYLPMPPLNELYVHGRSSPLFWQRIFRYCEDWLQLAQDDVPLGLDLARERRRLVSDKTFERLNEIRDSMYIDINKPLRVNGRFSPGLRDIAERCSELAAEAPFVPGVLHGDFCFSNIILDSRAGRIRLIDPRGIEEPSSDLLYSDLLYDVGKFAHSVVGGYDLIIAGHCDISGNWEDREFDLSVHFNHLQNVVARQFVENGMLEFRGPQIRSVLAVVVLLFISMVPLHSDRDDRQKAFIANAVRIYLDYIEE